jgi:glutamine amidotransferase
MGWNSLTQLSGPLFQGINESDDVYFVHSYYAELCENTVATCDYIVPFSAAMNKDNFYATQFHPEKSGKVGEQILMNFLKL